MLTEPSVTSSSPSETIVRPFLKWAGGKRQLLPVLRGFYPARFDRYMEPFLGSGAVFFDLYSSGLLKNRQSILIDNNADLIGCYMTVRDHVDELIESLQRLAREHARARNEHFYYIRDRKFNPVRRNMNRSKPGAYPVALAAMFIYLNRTGFNGLYRLNAAGDFNVPAGRYTSPQICDGDNLRLVSQALRNNVTLIHGSFETVQDLARAGDFLYFDPPYAPLTRTARFTSYTADQFTSEHQRRLHGIVVDLSARGCKVVVSNSTADEIAALYEGSHSQTAGLRAHVVSAKRAINSKADLRGKVPEYVLSNSHRPTAGN
jgi:DNA adenine methylase